MLAAARQALHPLDPASAELALLRAPLVSNKAVLYFLGRRSGRPLYVVKAPSCAAGLTAAAEYSALRQCHAWWAAEDRHRVAQPLALLRAPDAYLMVHVPGPPLSHVLSQPVLQPRRALAATAAAGDFLRRFHRHARYGAMEVDVLELVGKIREVEASEMRAAGLALPARVARILDAAPRERLCGPCVRLHGDYAPRNLILWEDGEVAMIDPVLDAVGPAEEDLATFLSMLSSASIFAAGLALPPMRRLRLDLEGAFRTAYGVDVVSPVILRLTLIRKLMRRWAYRRGRRLGSLERRLASLRERLIDAQMRALLEECAMELPWGGAR